MDYPTVKLTLVEKSAVINQMTLSESFHEPLEKNQPMKEDDFEFSDNPDIDFETMQTRVRTRSQSRTKESSIPPAEPVKEPARKQTRVKRGAKKADPDYGPRRRRKIVEVKEEQLSEISDDDTC